MRVYMDWVMAKHKKEDEFGEDEVIKELELVCGDDPMVMEELKQHFLEILSRETDEGRVNSFLKPNIIN